MQITGLRYPFGERNYNIRYHTCLLSSVSEAGVLCMNSTFRDKCLHFWRLCNVSSTKASAFFRMNVFWGGVRKPLHKSHSWEGGWETWLCDQMVEDFMRGEDLFFVADWGPASQGPYKKSRDSTTVVHKISEMSFRWQNWSKHFMQHC